MSQSSVKIMKKVLFLLKLFVLGTSFSYAIFKLRTTDAAEFCYKCEESCRKPPLIEKCNTSTDNNPFCIVEKDPINNTEKRSCAYPSREKEAINKCNSSDPSTCRVCPQDLCNVPRRLIKGASKCYYCQRKCKNPLETTDCFFIDSGCVLVTALSYDKNQNKTELVDFRECVKIIEKANPNQVCKKYKKIINSSAPINCTVCQSPMCNHLLSDPSSSDASFLKSYKVLLGSLIFIIIFFIK